MADRGATQASFLPGEMLELLRNGERTERRTRLVEGLDAVFVLVCGERGGGDGVDHVEIA